MIAAPTGSGKTLAAFLAAIDDLVRQGLDGALPDAVQVVYVSPLKALSNDIHRNLEAPLEGIRRELARSGFADVAIRTLVRTGDTAANERARMRRSPPHILVTTPESLYVLLGSEFRTPDAGDDEDGHPRRDPCGRGRTSAARISRFRSNACPPSAATVFSASGSRPPRTRSARWRTC